MWALRTLNLGPHNSEANTFPKSCHPRSHKKILLTPFFRSGNPYQPAKHSTICQGNRTDKLGLITGSPPPGCVFYLLWDVILRRVSACDLFPEQKEEWTQRVRQGSRYLIPAGSAGLVGICLGSRGQQRLWGKSEFPTQTSCLAT